MVSRCESTRAFVRNAWYVAGWSVDFDREPIRRMLLDEPVVLFRKRDGTLCALEDRCPHRFLPLSMGRLVGDTLECGYHGLRFDAGGMCVSVPGQSDIPAGACVPAYPVTERMGLAWVWMGDTAAADENDVFDLPQYHDSAWRATHGDAMHVHAGYLSLADNLCDPAHVSFVHTSTLGSASGIGVPVQSKTDGHTIVTWRWTLRAEPVGFFKRFGGFAEGQLVDRWQYYYLHAPSTAVIDFGSMPARSVAEHDESRGLDDVPPSAPRAFACHFLTPETRTTAIDYWLHVRNFDVDDACVDEAINEQLRIAFAEDKLILEAIEAEEARLPHVKPVRIRIDAGAARLRRVIDEMLAEESPAA